MITVGVYINSNLIFTCAAVQVKKLDNRPDGLRQYRLDDGTLLTHRRGDGANALGARMLENYAARQRWSETKTETEKG